MLIKRGAFMTVFTYAYKIRYSDVGVDNKLTLKALVSILQESAISHSNSVGFGINNANETHLAWLLLNWKVQMFSHPHCEEELTVKTWPRVFDRLYSFRDFEVYDKDNNLVAIASSKWFPIDTVTKKIKKITSEITAPYGEPVVKSVFKEPFKDKIVVPEDLELNFNYTIQRRDIDTNGHVNNLHYIDFALETLNESIYNENEFNNLEIIYKKEIKYNEKINCYYSLEDNKHIVTIKNEDNSIVHAIVQLY